MESLPRFFNTEGPAIHFLVKWAQKAYEERDMIQLHIHLILSALFPIYIGSHASLRRPPSAKYPTKPTSKDNDDDDINPELAVEGLTPSDAIMFPVLAGITLAILYGIIKWLEDPSLINKILTWYFSVIGVFGVGKLAGDSFHVGTSFFFPSVWSSGGKTYRIDPALCSQIRETVSKVSVQENCHIAEAKINPLPGPLSNIKFPASINQKLWSLRALLKNRWIFRCYVHGIANIKSRTNLNDAMGLVLGAAVIVLYNISGKAWWLTNLIGFGLCYGTLQLLSPTTFWTGSLVLVGLFVYDITMVFYTPLMVTVATSLDVPIKLVFPGPRRSMLGLGDIVLPGIMMALALRFDLYLHYLRKQLTPLAAQADSRDGRIIKAPYVEATGAWGERFWTSKSGPITTMADGARFSKVYFKASIVGYTFGMLTTMIVLNIFNHAQPALLYLVPGVLIALWGTAAVRGEWSLMWGYTEDGSLEANDTDTGGSKGMLWQDKELMMRKVNEHAHHVFLISLSEPKRKRDDEVESLKPLKEELKEDAGEEDEDEDFSDDSVDDEEDNDAE